MSFVSDLKVLYHLVASPIRGNTHQQRLESFYKGQAKDYDDFRKRLLQGRQDLWNSLPKPAGGVWMDMGGGTGANLEYFGDGIKDLSKVYVVDLAGSLLEVARERVRDRGWTHVEAVEADATAYVPPEGQVDVVTFSYSLTMIPDWFAAMDHAWRLLKPGGILGVVDFYVGRKYPATGRSKHGWFTRTFWPTWFSSDNVFPCGDHLPYLMRKFEPIEIVEQWAKIPYIPFIRAPYYRFVGRKPLEPTAPAETLPPGTP